MKKMFILMTLIFSTNGYTKVDQDIEKVKVAMKSIIGVSKSARDLKVDVYKVNESICGSEEQKAIIIDLKVVRTNKEAYYNNDPFKDLRNDPFRDFKQVTTKKEFQIIKTYAVLLSDVRKNSATTLSKFVLDAEDCME